MGHWDSFSPHFTKQLNSEAQEHFLSGILRSLSVVLSFQIPKLLHFRSI